MRRDGDIHIPNLNPDFREMSEKDLRKGLSELNRTIKTMKKYSGRYFPMLDDIVSLRQKFKAVWRARPGRPFFDIEARRRREAKRRRMNGADFIPPFGF